MGDGRPEWSVRVRPGGGADARSFSFDPRLAGVAALVGVLLVAAAGAVVGGLVERHRTSERLAELGSRVEQLRERQGRVAALASRLDSVEEAYRRVRRSLVPGEGPDPGPGLPTPPGGDVPPGAAGAGDDALPAGWPLARPGFVTRRFRPGSGPSGHPGLDVAVPTGSYVRSVESGVVLEVGRDPVYGRFVRVRHSGGYASLYGHASRLFVQPGDSVSGGEVLGLSGNSGRSTAPHLHVEVRREGEAVDPLRFFREAS